MMPALHDLRDERCLVYPSSPEKGSARPEKEFSALIIDLSQCCWLGTMSYYGHHDGECSSSSDHGIGDLLGSVINSSCLPFGGDVGGWNFPFGRSLTWEVS